MAEKGDTVKVELDEQDAQTLRNLAGEYRTSSAHECLWDRLYEACNASLSEAR